MPSFGSKAPRRLPLVDRGSQNAHSVKVGPYLAVAAFKSGSPDAFLFPRSSLGLLHSARRGTYRILYRIADQTRTVTVLAIGHRGDI